MYAGWVTSCTMHSYALWILGILFTKQCQTWQKFRKVNQRFWEIWEKHLTLLTPATIFKRYMTSGSLFILHLHIDIYGQSVELSTECKFLCSLFHWVQSLPWQSWEPAVLYPCLDRKKQRTHRETQRLFPMSRIWRRWSVTDNHLTFATFQETL